MAKYIIEYQLEDEEPKHKVVTGKTKNRAEGNLEKQIIEELVSFGLEDDEAEEEVDKMTILSIEEV